MSETASTERQNSPETSSNDQKNEEDKKDDSEDKKQDNSKFECNICLEFARDPVVSLCGHLFCWPCLHQWLLTRPNQQLCPVCKAAVSRENVIPLYGRSGNDADPRDKVPPRPKGIRTEEPTSSNWQFSDPHGHVQFSLGIGIFPVSFVASIFSTTTTSFVGERRSDQPNVDSQQQVEERLLSNIFFALATCFFLWLFLT
ncbi:hypothetical protein M3Y97_00899400 [Aphelenchoides bicaudatus]|nr:hypothetical protein M3Y97_00899400 [Aphelenchoides bicaudatus]